MNYSYKTHSKRILGDLHTPVSIYLKVRDMYPESALLESSDFHANENSLSFIALCPIASIGINSGMSTMRYPDNHTEELPVTDAYTVADALNDFLKRFKVEGDNSEVCGLFGYTAFDAVRYFEKIEVMESHHAQNDAPDMYYLLYKYILVFNHFKNELTLIELLREGEASEMERIETMIENRNYASYNFIPDGKETSPITDDEYRAMVRKGVAHCMRGDVFQIVLARQFKQAFRGDDFKVYRALRSINPSPYLFYFDFGGFRIFGSSPEAELLVEGRRATIHPIAGTYRRSGHGEEDARAVERLRSDPKENAEHVMLVDLARNDLSKHCEAVHVERFKEVQQYSHVIHLVSRVSGTMNAGTAAIDLLADTFPAGTLSGAPKYRAMQLIDQFERGRRYFYGGAIGILNFNGDCTHAIMIRSFLSKDNVLFSQAGGGVVADSRPEDEVQEVKNKLGALKLALLKAEGI